MTATIKGLDKLSKKLKQLPEHVREGAGRAVREEAQAVANDMRRWAPRDTGELADSIQSEYDAATLTGTAAATARHATFVAQGTSENAKDPFADNAAAASRKRFPGRVEDEIARALRELSK